MSKIASRHLWTTLKRLQEKNYLPHALMIWNKEAELKYKAEYHVRGAECLWIRMNRYPLKSWPCQLYL
jgi:hypothetical protein